MNEHTRNIALAITVLVVAVGVPFYCRARAKLERMIADRDTPPVNYKGRSYK